MLKKAHKESVQQEPKKMNVVKKKEIEPLATQLDRHEKKQKEELKDGTISD
ncbi:MAG: hypothetical protein ACRC0A_01610 [Chitinophagaceae bacterium]